ncbi:hypothetical protein HNR03_002074 [Pseudomonas sp. JAI111]|uniref:hypothetical protein n=1 Tax=unclassified Pseudomonas TaxID=196821 RepID=UPI001C994995|nr:MULTISPECIES: hypothetical protein [unclassified Pseudomonas]MCS3837476.1 hypothetical protein [Pseudomonas sp. JAI111]QZP33233.1 hypothetical protein K5K95_02130 [Pseudomonas sp. DR48]
MDDKQLIASLLNKINHSQLALSAAIDELSIWAEKQGAIAVAGNIRDALETVDQNQEFISLALLSISSDFQGE